MPNLPKQTSAERDLVSWIQWKKRKAMNRQDEELSATREQFYDIYLGEPYGDEEEGYSKVVTREVLESIEWAMPGLMRTMLHAPAICAFVPGSAADREAARQETQVCNDDIRCHNDTWEVFNAWMRDALMYPNGYAKIWWDEIDDPRTQLYEQLTPIQVALLESNENVDILEVAISPERSDLLDVLVVHHNFRGDIQIAAIPPEDVLVDSSAFGMNLDKIPWVAHNPRMAAPTRSELLRMGYDPDIVEQLNRVDRVHPGTETESRRKYIDEDGMNANDSVAMEDEPVDYCESYGWVDFDGDGVSEYRRIVTSGSYILDNEETNFQPICTLGTIPQSHRHVCLSMTDLSMDIQRINTVQNRQMLDNLYRTNRPRQFAGRGVNIEQLMSYAPFGVVEMSDPTDVQVEQIPSVIQQVIPAIEFQRNNLENRTGMSRMMQGMDADKIAQTTMGAYFEALGMANQRLEYIARNFAETGFKNMIQKAHQLRRTHGGGQEIAVKLSGKWVDVDPADWLERKNLEAKIGIGTGTQRERLTSSRAILETQKEALPLGLTTKSRVFSALEDFTMAMGHTDPTTYFLDPDSDEAKQIEAQATQKQQEQEAKQQEQIQKVIEAEVAPKMAKVMADLEISNQRFANENAKLRQQVEDMLLKHDREVAKMELDHEVDIEGAGIESGQVTPLRTGNER